MILKDKTNFLVPECRQLFLVELERAGAVESDAARAGCIERSEYVQERALPTPGRPSDGNRIAERQAE